MIDLQTLTLSAVPRSEDGTFEFKSGSTPFKELRKKIDRAASAFANSGGGCFLAGVDDSGDADGGLAAMVGRQSLRDWVDQAIGGVEPPVPYEIRLIDDVDGRGTLQTGKVILAIGFRRSEMAPHMSSDSRYYIRAGAHTVRASAFIVESLWARRGINKPILTHAVRTKPEEPQVVQIGVVAVNAVPALDVEFNIVPIQGPLKKIEKYFPIRLPIVDRDTPFFVDSGLYYNFPDEFDDQTVVVLKYKDALGNSYEHKSTRPLREAISPLRLGTEPADKIVKAIKELSAR